jgi:hypothetical protein
VLKSIKAFPNTKSNFFFIKHNKPFKVFAENKLYLLTTDKGLILTSSENASVNHISSNNAKLRGRLLQSLQSNNTMSDYLLKTFSYTVL